VLSPGEVLAAAGKPVPGLVIVGVGTIELDSLDGESDQLGPGDFLFPAQVLGGESAPRTARAGSKGAIVLFGARALAHELLLSCPPLLEIFAGM
jgi:CRP-like cAMP-binding protein